VRIVEILWTDAHVTTGETTIKKAEKMKGIRTRTVAFLVAENDEGVILATDIYPDIPKRGKIVNFIPWGMIDEYHEYVY